MSSIEKIQNSSALVAFTSSFNPPVQKVKYYFKSYFPEAVKDPDNLMTRVKLLKYFGLVTVQDLELICTGLQSAKALDKNIKKVEGMIDELGSLERQNDQDAYERVSTAKEMIEIILKNPLNPLHKHIYYKDIPLSLQKQKEKLQEILKELQNISQGDLRNDPEKALRTPLSSLLTALKALKDLEREKMTTEINAYLYQLDMRSLWIRNHANGINTLSSLKEAKQLEPESFFNLCRSTESLNAIESEIECYDSDALLDELIQMTHSKDFTSHDIRFFWIARMLLLQEYVCGQVHFPAVSLEDADLPKTIEAFSEQQVSQSKSGEKRNYFDLMADELIQKIILYLDGPWIFFLLNHHMERIAKDSKTSILFLENLCKKLNVKTPVLKAVCSSMPSLSLKEAKDFYFHLQVLRKNQVICAEKLKIPSPKTKGLLALQGKIEEKLITSRGTTDSELYFIEGIKNSDPLIVFSILAAIEEAEDKEMAGLVEIVKKFFSCPDEWPSNEELLKELVYRLYDCVIELPKTPIQRHFLDRFIETFLQFQDVKKATETISEMSFTISRDKALIKIVRHLAKKERRSEATELVKTIKDPAYQAMGFSIILAINGEIDQAKDTANAISHKDVRSSTFYEIADILTEQDRVNLARDFAERILNNYKQDKASVLEKIVLILIKHDQLVEAEEVANTIIHEPHQSKALDALSRALVQKGNFDQAKDVAERVSNKKLKSSLLEYSDNFKNLFNLLLQGDTTGLNSSLDMRDLHDGVTEAIALANALPDDHEMKPRVLDLIKIALIQKMKTGGIDEVALVMKKSPQTKSLVFQAFAETSEEEVTIILKNLVNKRQLDLAIELAKTIKESERYLVINPRRDAAIGDISSFLAECGEIDQAVNVVFDNISDASCQSNTLSNVVSSLINKDIEQAQKIANRIPDESIKSSSLGHISVALNLKSANFFTFND